MTAAQTKLPRPTLTFEAYLDEGEINQRYDIVDGIRVMAPAPVYLNQVVSDNITEIFRHFVRARRTARAVSSPIDILIQKRPLRTRQPDVLLMSETRYVQNGGRAMQSPLTIAPELVVEILSPSDRQEALAQKLADYRRVDVRECWLVDIIAQTVERLRLIGDVTTSEGVFGAGDTLSSLVFPDLRVSVSEILAE
jgi:Uma2 family endonuclease